MKAGSRIQGQYNEYNRPADMSDELPSQDNSADNILRYFIAGVLLAAVGFLVVIQVVRIQFSAQKSAIIEEGGYYQVVNHTYYPPRGNVYDRWGRLLAGNVITYEVGVLPLYVNNIQTIIFALTSVLADHPTYGNPDAFSDYGGYDKFIRQMYDDAVASNVSYRMLADYVTQDELDKLREWATQYANMPDIDYGESGRPSLAGLVFVPRMMRTYPEDEMASNVLGYVNRDSEGVFGVEEKYNGLLAGNAVSMLLSLDPAEAPDIPQVEPGADLVLTLDREIQAMVEQTLDEALNETGSSAGTVVVMNPTTGDILAMATTPRLNLNQFWKFGEVFANSPIYNPAVSQMYEPGSVFKVLTMAAALDAGAVTPDSEFVDTGSIEIGGIVIRNWDWGAWGPQNMQGCLQHSLNVCLTWVATQLGAGPFYTYLQDFGFGRLTGIDLAEENPGLLRLPSQNQWFESDLGTNSFGQGISVTPIQMVMAISAVANERGEMMAPRIVRSIVRDGYQYNIPSQVVGTPISADTAQTLTEMLSASLENESSVALVDGYQVAGKTGTAQIPLDTGQYSLDYTNASFVGWGPVNGPQFLVYVWLEKPTSSPWGSVVAAPLFRDIVQQLVVLMEIPPDAVRQELANP